MQGYKTLFALGEAKITEKKSDFIAAAVRTETEEEALEFLKQRRVLHRTASHNVYAYAINENARQRYSDDGEPAKTAGLPVLSVLTHAKLTNCIVVVTRYFGGTLLGTGGLVRAYTSAAQAAIAAAGIFVVESKVRMVCTIAYPLYEPVRRVLEEASAHIDEPVFTNEVCINAVVKTGAENEIVQKINEICRGNAKIVVSEPFCLFGT